jgi:catechol 2,3-dioxygenase-like lactoylglutathione lyase family enzyme
MIDHVSIGVKDVAASAAFYDAVLKPLGWRRVLEILPYTVGFGCDEHPRFWVNQPLDETRPPSAGNGTHFCFRAPNRAAVEEFYAVALSHGGVGDGTPGLRPDYHPHYYAAFIRDLDGHKIEAVTHTPEP